MDREDPFEVTFHRLLTYHTPTHLYEKSIRDMTRYHSSSCIYTVEQFRHLIQEPAFETWYRCLLYQNYMERYGREQEEVSSDKKYRNLIVRKLLRVAYTDVKIMRILDFLLYKSTVHAEEEQ